MPVLNPEHLLEQADRLLSFSFGGSRRQVDLRRAISNSYYAVFHHIITDSADEIMGKAHRQTPRYALAYRSVDHRSLSRLCEDVVKPTLPVRLSNHVPPGGFGRDLVAVATAVTELQNMRHLADYDPLYRATVSHAVLALETARTALERYKNVSSPERKAFLALVVFPPR